MMKMIKLQRIRCSFSRNRRGGHSAADYVLAVWSRIFARGTLLRWVPGGRVPSRHRAPCRDCSHDYRVPRDPMQSIVEAVRALAVVNRPFRAQTGLAFCSSGGADEGDAPSLWARYPSLPRVGRRRTTAPSLVCPRRSGQAHAAQVLERTKVLGGDPEYLATSSPTLRRG